MSHQYLFGYRLHRIVFETAPEGPVHSKYAKKKKKPAKWLLLSTIMGLRHVRKYFTRNNILLKSYEIHDVW